MLHVVDGNMGSMAAISKVAIFHFCQNFPGKGHHKTYRFRLARSQKFNCKVNFQLRSVCLGDKDDLIWDLAKGNGLPFCHCRWFSMALTLYERIEIVLMSGSRSNRVITESRQSIRNSIQDIEWICGDGMCAWQVSQWTIKYRNRQEHGNGTCGNHCEEPYKQNMMIKRTTVIGLMPTHLQQMPVQ